MLSRKQIKRQAEALVPRDFWTPIESIEVAPALSGHKFKGSIQLGKSRRVAKPVRFDLAFDDLWDLKDIAEGICVSVGGRLYLKRAPKVNLARLQLERVLVGPVSVSPVAVPSGFEDRGWYIGLETPEGECYHNYFVHLEDLIGLLHRCVLDAQGLKRNTTAGAIAAVYHDRNERRTLQ